MKLPLLDRLLQLREGGTPLALATDLKTGEQLLITAEDVDGDLDLMPQDVAHIRSTLTCGRSFSHMTDQGEVFIEMWPPDLRLLVVGGVHTAQPLTQMARMTGYDVTIIDPRSGFLTADRFPDTTIVNEWPNDALPLLNPDSRTAIVTLTHDPKIDDPALVSALQSEAFYIGALGSRRTQAERRHRLSEAGWSATDIARIHGPVGLAIGALTPAEIAISIMAEITAVLRQSSVGSSSPLSCNALASAAQ